MYPGRFDYHAPTSLDEAVALLADLGPEAKLLAGGASLIPLMKLRLAEPGHLVDLGRVPGLDGIAWTDAGVSIGAMVREADLGTSDVARRLPIIGDACRVIADPLVRNVGTVGGNVAHGDPANDHPAVMLALDAVLEARGPAGDRTIRAADFHVDLLETALRPDEVMTAIHIAAPADGLGTAYVKFERQVGDFAMAAAAVVLEVTDGRASSIRIALTNAGPTPVRALTVEAALAGGSLDDASIARALSGLDGDIHPWADLRGSVEVKRSMARAVTERALRLARARAQGDGR